MQKKLYFVSLQANTGSNGSNILFYQHSQATSMFVTCSICGKQFVGRNRRQKLSNHLLIHSGFKPFLCNYCDYKSTQKGHVKRHLECVHKINEHNIPGLIVNVSNSKVAYFEENQK